MNRSERKATELIADARPIETVFGWKGHGQVTVFDMNPKGSPNRSATGSIDKTGNLPF